MFCVIYKFTVKPDHEDQFRQHWLAVTKHLYQHAGSLGSRLHRAQTWRVYRLRPMDIT